MISNMAEWLGLHWAHEGSVLKLNSHYTHAPELVVRGGAMHAGQLAGKFLAAAFEDLISSGLLALGQADPLGQQRVCVTYTGQARYEQLRSTSINTEMMSEEHGKHRQPGRDEGSP